MDNVYNKIDVIKMINTVNANSNVGRILVRLDSSNGKWNYQIMTSIINMYTNVYDIYVNDCSD